MQSMNMKHFSSATAAMHGSACMLVDMWGSGGLTSAVGWKNGICQGGGDVDRSTTLLLEGCS